MVRILRPSLLSLSNIGGRKDEKTEEREKEWKIREGEITRKEKGKERM